MRQGRTLSFNNEVIAETEAYFETKYKSFYKKNFWDLMNDMLLYLHREV